MRRRIRALIVLVAVLAMVGASCSSGSDEPATEIDVTTADFTFTPDSWTVVAGQDLPISITNDGSVEHEWVIMKAPIDSEDGFTEEGVLWEAEAAAGETKTETVPALEAGTYQIICGIPGHFAAGMKGELVVEASS